MHMHASPPVPRDLQCHLVRWAGFADLSARPFIHHMPADTFIPLIINFADPYLLHAGHRPDAAASHRTFTAGLIDRFTVVRSAGAVHCMQVDFSPAGARAFFRLPLSEITGEVVGLDTLLGQAGRDIVEQLALCRDWRGRFTILEQFLRLRLRQGPAQSAAVGAALSLIEAHRGQLRIADLARHLEISREHLARRFAADVGIGPKAYARIVRFQQAMHGLRASGDSPAAIAHDSGFADQAHMIRDVKRMAGFTPLQL